MEILMIEGEHSGIHLNKRHVHKFIGWKEKVPKIHQNKKGTSGNASDKQKTINFGNTSEQQGNA